MVWSFVINKKWIIVICDYFSFLLHNITFFGVLVTCLDHNKIILLPITLITKKSNNIMETTVTNFGKLSLREKDHCNWEVTSQLQVCSIPCAR